MNYTTSRKAFLKGAIGLFAAGMLGEPARAYASKDTGASDLAPSGEPQGARITALGNSADSAGVRIRGINHVLKFEDKSAQDNNNGWAALWRVWDWENWIEPQLNDIAKLGNAVRFWGNTLVLALDNVTLDQYLGRWAQALDYTQTLGLFIYPCGGDLLHWGDYPLDKSVECYRELSKLFAGYSHVVGMDIVNEAAAFPWNQQNKPLPDNYRQPEPYDEFIVHLGDAVRESGVPITYSRNLWSARQWAKEGPLDAKGDFLDFHVYYTPDPTDSLPVYDTSWGRDKKMIIGEFGMGMDMTSDERDAFYTAVGKLSVTDKNCVGAFAWSAYDPFTTPIWQTGLFDRQGLQRDDIVKPFLNLPL